MHLGGMKKGHQRGTVGGRGRGLRKAFPDPVCPSHSPAEPWKCMEANQILWEWHLISGISLKAPR